VLQEEARTILAEINVEGMHIDPESFRQGLEVELEHGTRYQSANVTNNHPILTGKIVLAHLKERNPGLIRPAGSGQTRKRSLESRISWKCRQTAQIVQEASAGQICLGHSGIEAG